MKNFRPEDFAKYHPGGKLGKRLLLKVSDLMIPLDKCPVLDPQTAVMEDVLMALTEFGLGLVLFLDGGRMAGILTDGDIRRLLQQRRQELFNLKVSDLINRAPLTVSPDLKAVDALGFMENRQRPLNVVLVSEGTRVLGVVRLHELVAVS